MSARDDQKDEIHQLETVGGEVTDEPDLKRRHANTQLDDAAKLLDQAGRVIEYTAKDSKRVVNKIDLWVCAPMCLVYLLQWLDKTTLSYAAVFGLREQTHLKGPEYSWLTSCVYITQLIVQPISSYALIVFPVKYWVLFNYFGWTVCLICLGAAKNFTGLLVARIFLGGFESTILPSFILITQMWYTRREQSFRVVNIQLAVSVGGFIGPLIGWGVGHIHGKLLPYQNIFIVIGAISLGFLPIVAFMLPNSPVTARFLRQGDDRLIAVERLRQNNTGTKASKFKWNQFWETMRDIKTWLWFSASVCVTIPGAAIGAFGGLITKGFGYNQFETMLLQMPVGMLGIILVILFIHLINRYKIRWPFIAFICIPSVAGAAGITNINPANKAGRMGAYYVMATHGAIQPLLISWVNINAGGTTKRVITTSLMFVGSCAGNAIGPFLYFDWDAPTYHIGLYCDLAVWALLFVIILILGQYLAHLNRKQIRRRRELGLPEQLEDMSIMSIDEAEEYKSSLVARMREQGVDAAELYENSFDDMTDFENPMFQYVR